MSYLPPEPPDPKKPTTTRLVLWIAVAGVGIYSIVQGIIGIMQRG
ncbi:MAG: hypothetical protein V4531_08305 [Actinomycetota bacterium]|jgi:hypothetical protein